MYKWVKYMVIKIKNDYLTLQQLLKVADLISSGGEAKLFLFENKAIINGIEDNRRGRKLHPGDIVEINGQKYEIA